MALGDELRKVRAEISRRSGRSEFSALENNPSLAEMRDQIQALKIEMNEAKKAAMTAAAEPYIEAITKLEADYAFFMKLSS